MIVVFADLAEADLEEIGDWIAEDDPIRAITFVSELRERGASLAEHPNRFPRVRDFDGLPLRKLSIRGYLMFYRVSTDNVEILRIVHGSRDWASDFATLPG